MLKKENLLDLTGKTVVLTGGAGYLGSILSLVSMSLLISEENSPTGDVRELAGNLAFLAVAAMSLMIFFSVSRLKENPEFQNRVNKNPFKAFRDVWVNPHAKILILSLIHI